jgi:hypothetical protein
MKAALQRLALRVWCAAPSCWWKSKPTKGNGLAAANDQPAKTLPRHATDFIAVPAGQVKSGEQLSFLPPLPFCPSWPTRGTLAALALERLMNGELLNHNDVIGVCGSWRLGAVIYDLRVLGWPIETISSHCPTVQSPDRLVALYRLDPKHTAAALALERLMNGELVEVPT